MLADPRSKALVDNFAAQWLFLRNLQSFVPDSDEFPNFDDNLRQAMRHGDELFFESIMREDRSVLDLLTADYTFVNERLARHYGIPNVYGSQFRRVTHRPTRTAAACSARASSSRSRRIRTARRPCCAASGSSKTSSARRRPRRRPTCRRSRKPATTASRCRAKALMEQHRENPACATCHRVMDPLGFSLENFDATGRWRVKEAAGVVDASGQLADGTPVDGPVGAAQGAS